MIRLIFITIILIWLNRGNDNSLQDPYKYANDLCLNMGGVADIFTESEIDLYFECGNGSTVYIKNFFIPYG